MIKCAKRILQLKLKTALFIALSIFVVVCNFACRPCNYTKLTRGEIKTLLYKSIHPDLHFKSSIPDCRYDFLESLQSINTWDAATMVANISAEGIVNGSYYPRDCKPLFSVALLVTYRDRQKQLDVFIPYIHHFLQKQNIHYRIYLVEQSGEGEWNKGVLYNIAAKQAITDQFSCLILHDIDMLPLDEANLYACLMQPRHLSAAVDTIRFNLPYYELVGGVLAIRTDQYLQVNGHSNRFFGWGGEDDDFFQRITASNLVVLRASPEMSRYTMLSHHPQQRNPQRMVLLAENTELIEGYNTVKISRLRISHMPLYTHLIVRL